MLDLLLAGGDHVLVPRAVIGEIETYGADDVTVQAIRRTPWLRVVEVGPIPDAVSMFDLGLGESAVLTWALAHPGCLAILDDRDARVRAAALGVSLTGTLGLIVEAKERGLIKRARPAIELARRAGLYLSDRVVRETLRLVGE